MKLNKFIDLLLSIFTVAAGVAIVALLVSKKSDTASVLQAWWSGNANLLAVAESPVTGAAVRIDTSYPHSGGMFSDLGSTFGGAGFPTL